MDLLLIDLGVFEAEEVEDAVEADRGDRLLRTLFHFGFGVEGDAETCLAEHVEVVGTVAYGDP